MGEHPGDEGADRTEKGREAARRLPRGAHPEQRAHQEAQIERGAVNEVALAHVGLAAKPNAAVLPGLAHVCEGPLDQLSASSL